MERLFRHAVAVEPQTRPEICAQRRRFIGVNVIYNEYWSMFTNYISANISPFCGQVLAGYPRQDRSVRGMLHRLRGRYLARSLAR